MSLDAVSQAIIGLFNSERFYAEIVAQMTRILDNKLDAVAGVRIAKNIELHINPVKFSELSHKQRISVLKHECEHILRDHISRAKVIAPEIFDRKRIVTEEDAVEATTAIGKHRHMNIAMDLAINCGIKDLPKWAVFPKNFGLKNHETFEWYLEELKTNEKAKNLTHFDEHSLWGDSEGSSEALKEKIRQAINKAAKKTRAAGMLTGEQELLVSKLNNKHSVDWRRQLKNFVARSTETLLETSKKKRNRRYGIMYPGSIKTEELHIGVAIDTSGSVSDVALAQFMVEIEAIAKFAKVTVVEADAEVKKSYVFKPKNEYKISGRGGTAYQPAFDFFNEEGTVDAVIYLGDMDTDDAETIKKPNYPVLWAIVGDQSPPADFGSIVRVLIDEN
jgi:predicted metal-dependent peptidase